MGIYSIDAAMLQRAFLAGAKGLEAKKEWINELNVFPVPDGDTGTNMTLTIMAAAREVAAIKKPTMESLAKAISSGSLRGARGNSGVILSQLFRGFSKEIKTVDEITTTTLANAFVRATETAYKAVMKPKEGTILTVARGMADKAVELVTETEDIVEFCQKVIQHGDYVLSQTPDMLPVLKQAGVVDSGGQGLMQVMKGVMEGLMGKEVDLSLEGAKPSGPAMGDMPPSSGEFQICFGYCTEFIINLEKPYDEKAELEFKAYLESIGDSIVVVSDENMVKIHVHTNDPGLAIQKAITYGSLSRIKIDNMREEHQEKLIKDARKLAAAQAKGSSAGQSLTGASGRKGSLAGGNAANGSSANGSSANGSSAQGSSANGSSAKSNAANGSSANGNPANGSLANGNAANGSSAHGSSANGSSANGNAANGSSANGNAANGSSAHGNAANGSSAHGNAANGNATHGSSANGSSANGNSANGNSHGRAKERKPYGFIAVSVGDGLGDIFRGIGADCLIEGGQTMNPSTEDMLNAIKQVNADTVYILPNNKNIILAAQQAKSLVKNKRVMVIPSKTVPQGITAIINFAPDLSPQDNAAVMSQEMSRVKTGQVTYAVRNTRIDDIEIKQGDIMGLGDHGILAVGKSISRTTMKTIEAMVDQDSELITIYYGSDITKQDAHLLLEQAQKAYPDCDVELHLGGQPIYYYLVSVE